MVERDLTEQLNSKVQEMLDEYDLEVFEEYWDLSREVLGDISVRKFYVQFNEGYGNVAVLSDELVVDIEGADDAEEGGLLNVKPLKALSSVEFRQGPVDTLPHSEDTQLVMLLYEAGTDDWDMHWTAENDDERRHLVNFGRAVIEAIAKR